MMHLWVNCESLLKDDITCKGQTRGLAELDVSLVMSRTPYPVHTDCLDGLDDSMPPASVVECHDDPTTAPRLVSSGPHSSHVLAALNHF